ncbi:endoplasmic reticulum-resident kdel protein [Aspergillus campestris IBT 28561]|uniref:Endoplasmic reticulum-resident kdel protein n=1 Tax=Aspergillus campestris (strain IBT 28561) TaxID=1392248 RepID=A0A2I1D1R9_ASPC2|nr:endoplasmic reticulum-resident kdel protein [Aspergillus campestris IBT 28561]PKY03806.1 endoplasmic reticulum-resident kdel protein [Aspergillus campestris IBT 28561]
MTLPGCSRWRLRQNFLLYLFYCAGFFCLFGIISIWFGMNTDRDYVHPLLTQLIPAGHCACQTSTTFQCSTCLSCPEQSPAHLPPPGAPSPWQFQSTRDANNESLDADQCQTAFPGLFEDVSRAGVYWRAHGYLGTEDLDRIPLELGMARAFIHRGELHVVAVHSKGEDHRRKILAVLSSIHRALVADARRAARRDIEFVFSVEDKVEDVTSSDNPVWVLARSATEEAVWLMPDFGFWAWDNTQNSIGPFDQVVERVKRADIPWSEKKQQLVWRGKPSFAPKLRRALMDATRGKSWGDVKQVDWTDGTNIMRMEDHCQYMFIAHVEGRSYSASLKYRQACNSVIVAHKLQYIQHHHYLLVPDGPHQNYIEVERDFNDLSAKMEPLLRDTKAAQRIADNSVRTFRERYLTKAAEACYWRALFDGYEQVWNSSVTVWSEQQQRERGLRYESFILLDSQSMLNFETM